MLPYVWTEASDGVLQGQDGFQDVTVAAKFRLLQPDFYPLSIGSASERAAVRAIVHFRMTEGWFLTGSAAYTWRGNVTLDRPSYFTDGQLYLTDEVAMPDVFDYTVSAGYRKGPLDVPITFSQQTTLGGGDIRRQDMPFVSNRMNLSRIG
jgi:hypothetical protein